MEESASANVAVAASALVAKAAGAGTDGRKGRAALGVDSDWDEETLFENTHSKRGHPYIRKPKASVHYFQVVNFHGVELRVMRSMRGRGFVRASGLFVGVVDIHAPAPS